MRGFLLDTDVISSLSPTRNAAPAQFLDWLAQMDGRLFLSVVSVHEIEKGVALLEGKGANQKASVLKAWLAGLVSTYGDRILGLDAMGASLSGQLEAKAIAAGHSPGMADAIVAGIAAAHSLTVLTFNTKHFLPFGVLVTSPDEVVLR